MDVIAGSIVRLSRLVTDFPLIQELDVNPLIVYEKGAKAVDARIILSQAEKGEF